MQEEPGQVERDRRRMTHLFQARRIKASSCCPRTSKEGIINKKEWNQVMYFLSAHQFSFRRLLHDFHVIVGYHYINADR
jgi:hypothetical protein